MDLPHRIEQARIAPLELEHWEPELLTAATGNRPAEMGAPETPVLNVLKTVANHPRLAKHFMGWAGQLLLRSSLPARDRELAILRVGWLCRATYEWTHHVEIGLDHAGLTAADIDKVRAGATPGSDAPDDVLLRAVDELVDDHFVSDATWALLATRYDQTQLMDLVFVIGNYTMISMALNSFGVQLEDKYR
ncbi:MAG: carboxymuconolactone decarboxylase family protein [Polymorphobacter sp.]